MVVLQHSGRIDGSHITVTDVLDNVSGYLDSRESHSVILASDHLESDHKILTRITLVINVDEIHL